MNRQIKAYKNRPTRAVINLSNLRNNYEIVKTFTGSDVKVMGIIKANAYGHGMLEVANELIDLGVDYSAWLFSRKEYFCARTEF